MKPADWTTEEALEKLFHPEVREHLQKAVKSDSPCIKYTVHEVTGRKTRLDLKGRNGLRSIRSKWSNAQRVSATPRRRPNRWEGAQMKKHIRSHPALVLLVLALVLAAGLVAAALSSSGSSNAKSAYKWTEEGKVSAAFARHLDQELFADKKGDAGGKFSAKVGASGENPTSSAEQNYELNGGDLITADNILGAQ